jgi:ATP-dependent 26S proteasome regulatory subunit
MKSRKPKPKSKKGVTLETMKKPPNPACVMIADPSVPWMHRLAMLRETVVMDSGEATVGQKWILERICQAASSVVYDEKLQRVQALLAQMEAGPCRSALFIHLVPANGSGVQQALVLLDDGTQAYTVVPDEALAASLRTGQRVIIESQGRALLRAADPGVQVGEIARLERVLNPRQVEISLRNGADHSVFFVTQDLSDQIAAGEVKPGGRLIVNPRLSVALAAIPPEDGLSHYRYLDKNPVPDICVQRDIGAPPRCIEDVTEHVRMELTRPEIRRRYKLRRCCTKLLCGVSGTGKSLAVSAIHRRICEVSSQLTGVPIGQLPKRVIRIRQSEILSMWWGETEKNWERAMDEAEQLADEPFTTPDGRQFKLPVLVIMEEVDGIGQARGHESVQSRVLPVLLQRLDPNRLEMADRLIVVLATTNVPQMVDNALVRRLGGSIEHFGRLKRSSFRAVLSKLVQGVPPAASNGCPPDQIWKRHVDDLTAWLFSPNSSDPGLVELTYAGSTTPVVKYRRDFLTGALLDRAVQQAAAEAALCDAQSDTPTGISFVQLVRAMDDQFRGMVDQLNEHNAGTYTDVPENVRVATLRRIPQPAHLPFEYQRT